MPGGGVVRENDVLVRRSWRPALGVGFPAHCSPDAHHRLTSVT